ncbi:MAG: amidohydrolase family protein [Acidobacteria bacterium]|nr:amidohydrolase family protein [Acidobacteriota bacterium]
MRNIVLGLVVATVFCLWSHTGRAATLEADMVIYNGKIITMDGSGPTNYRTVQAAAIHDGKFIAVGTTDEAMQYAGSGTRRIDLGGRTVIPGLVETHNHIYGYSSHFFPPDAHRVGGTAPSITWTNKSEFLDQIRTIALKKKPGEWILTSPRGGADSGMGVVVPLQQGELTRFDLDKVTPNNPVVIHWSVQSEAIVNTLALDPLLKRYPDMAGVRRDAAGVPTGQLAGLAIWTMSYEFWPTVPTQDLAPYYKMEMDEVAAEGLTTLSTRLEPDSLAAYASIHARGELPIRMPYSLESANRNPRVDATMSRLVGLQGGTGKNMWGVGDDKLWIIGMGLSNIDHVPGIGGSCVEKPYPREAVNFPLWRYQFYGPNGLCTLSSPDYNDAEFLRSAAKYGFRVSAMHSGGDRGINSFLTEVENLTKQYPDIPQRRWVIDHCRFINDEHAARAVKLGIIFSCGPKYVYSGERGDIGAYQVIYGEDVAADVVVPLRRLLDHGAMTSIQLDEHGFHPFLALQVAVTRKDSSGKAWGPQQRLTRQEALYIYTHGGGQYVLKEDKLGSIEPNKFADFVVLDKDYLTVPEDEIGRINPVLTVMDGAITYTEPGFATALNLPQVGFRGNPTWWKRGFGADATQARSGM